ncbi:Hypothetical predicted protein [Mytilus galloprovincialis]|uniref:Uncharacterized protein n=1 Tax=Mytilus galloprovincialis TaxID=29158 RepID=A0A8B6FPA0_MYTGA|nr:Hypothetical predicted protein [Mytilus galloprovincialis]
MPGDRHQGPLERMDNKQERRTGSAERRKTQKKDGAGRKRMVRKTLEVGHVEAQGPEENAEISSVNKQMKADLEVWLDFIKQYNGVTVITENVWVSNEKLKLFTDSAGGPKGSGKEKGAVEGREDAGERRKEPPVSPSHDQVVETRRSLPWSWWSHRAGGKRVPRKRKCREIDGRLQILKTWLQNDELTPLKNGDGASNLLHID